MRHFKSLFTRTKAFGKVYVVVGILLSYAPMAWAMESSNKEYKLATAIANEYVRAFSSQTEELDLTAGKKDTPIYEVRPAKLDAADIRKVIFNNILAKSDKVSDIQESMEPILNTYAWGDLKLFYGTTTAPGYNFISRINRTTTVVGEAVLATLLVTPTSNLIILQERQDILRLLLNSPKHLATLKQQLQTYQDVEQSLISLWSRRDPLYSKEHIQYMESNFYAKGKVASNKLAKWLEFRKRIRRDFLSIGFPLLHPLLKPLIIEMFLTQHFSSIPNWRKHVWKATAPYYGAWFIWDEAMKKDKAYGITGTAWRNAIGPIFREIGYTNDLIDGISNYLKYSSVLRNLALRMADVQTFLLTITQVSQAVAASPELEATFGQHLTAVRQLLACSKEKSELGRLLTYLQELPLNDWSYFFNNAGKLLAAYKLFVEHQDAFTDAMYEIGLLDAYLSFATLMQEASTYNREHAYVFAQFLDRTQKPKPYIQIEDMWNPFLDSKQAVGNNLEMNAAAGGTRTIILTGPNAGGKSTFLTGVTHTLLLAHVMGIGPAGKIVLTPFNRINTYIDMADDIAAGKSLFMTEVDRAQKHIQILKNLKPDEFSFTIFDEPFSGTNPIEGAAAEYSILEALANYTNSLTMVATHYPTVMLLEERASNKGFANYKVYITRVGTSRKLNYTYKIVPGKSTQAIAIDILEEQGYDTQMLARAREIIEYPERFRAKF